jgi:signal transduction histidine kinase
VLSLVLATVLTLPLAGILASGIYDDQLVHRTEAELLAQSVALAVGIARDAAASLPADVALGAEVSDRRVISLDADLAATRPPRPDATPAAPADPAFQALGQRVAPDLAATQAMTLAGFRLLDPAGTVIAGRGEVGLSLAQVEEVSEALRGRTTVTLRRRVSKHPYPPLGSLSRGRPYRLFVAVPIVVRHRVAGVLYASRTPVDVLGSLYGQREALGLAAAAVVAATMLAGLVLHRAISLPVRELVALTRAIGAGDRAAVASHRHHGTAEFAVLAGSLRDMAMRLTKRNDAVSSFAAHVSHELKSPLSAIRGTVELLRDDDAAAPMEAGDRHRFLDHLLSDAERLGALLSRLREMARAEAEPTAGRATVEVVLEGLRARFATLSIRADGELGAEMGVSAENLVVLLSHLADNAARHGAATLHVSVRRDGPMVVILVRDDGTGISPGNRARVFDSFFTTRREEGGTGMGLSIVRALIEAHGGTVELTDTVEGAGFALAVPVRPGPSLGSEAPGSTRHRRWRALAATLAIVLTGLAVRGIGPGLGLPFAVTKYGGSVLWGAMIYGISLVLVPAATRGRLATAAMTLALLVELFRLLHAPWLDAFRMTTAGALLLGRVFSVWNLAAYMVGIATAWGIDRSTGSAADRGKLVVAPHGGVGPKG